MAESVSSSSSSAKGLSFASLNWPNSPRYNPEYTPFFSGGISISDRKAGERLYIADKDVAEKAAERENGVRGVANTLARFGATEEALEEIKRGTAAVEEIVAPYYEMAQHRKIMTLGKAGLLRSLLERELSYGPLPGELLPRADALYSPLMTRIRGGVSKQVTDTDFGLETPMMSENERWALPRSPLGVYGSDRDSILLPDDYRHIAPIDYDDGEVNNLPPDAGFDDGNGLFFKP